MGKRGAVSVWAIIFASVLIATQYGKVPPSQPSMIECLGLTYTMQGLLMTAFSAAAVAMALLGGTLIDRLGARRVVTVALLVSVAGNVAGFFAESDALLLASRVLEGAGYGVTMTAGPVLISAWYAPAKRGLVSGVWGANVGVGMLVSLGVANPILAATDWTGMWVFSLAATVLAALLVALLVRMPPEAERRDLEELRAAREGERHGVLWGYAAPLALLTAFMFFLVGGATDSFNSFTITYLNVELGHGYDEANAASMIASLGMLAGSIVAGVAFARARDKGMVLIVNIALCAAVQFLWFNLNASMPVMHGVAFVAGCVLGAAPALFFAIPPFVARSSSTVGAAVSLIVLGQNLGTLAVPTIIGAVLDHASYSAAALVMGLLSLVALAAAVVFRVRFRRRAVQ